MTKQIKISTKDYEQIKAEWFDETAIIPPQAIFHRYDRAGKRIYIVETQSEDKEGKIIYEYTPVTSVTSIISACTSTDIGLKKWWQQNDKSYTDWVFRCSAGYGTWLHVKYSELFLKKKIPFEQSAIRLDMFNFFGAENEKYGYGYYDFHDISKYLELEKRNPQKDLYAMYRFIKDRDVKPIAIEYPLYDTGIKAGGVADLICEMDFNKKRIIAMIDYKTGKHPLESHGVQLGAYAAMWNIVHAKITIDPFAPSINVDGEVAIEAIFNWHPTDYRLSTNIEKLQPYKLINRTDDIEKYEKKWGLYIQQYYLDNPEIPEIKYIDFNPELYDITIDSDIEIKEIDVIENLKELKK
jgi:hypothetical protein